MYPKSQKVFWDVINKLGYDNSMGDYNRFVFAFIDDNNLVESFEQFLIDNLDYSELEIESG